MADTDVLRDELRKEMLPQFTDDYIDEWTAKGNDLTKLHQILDDFADELLALIANERREAKIEVLDYIIKKHAAHVTSPRTNCTVVNSIIADLKKTQLQPTKEQPNE